MRPGEQAACAERWTHLTSPNSASFALVSSVNGVEAMTHTSPVDSLMAVERPPAGKTPSKVKGLRRSESLYNAVEVARCPTYLENVQTSGAT